MNSEQKETNIQHPDEDCAICMTKLGVDFSKIYTCEQCKKPLHTECVQQQRAANCALCRHPITNLVINGRGGNEVGVAIMIDDDRGVIMPGNVGEHRQLAYSSNYTGNSYYQTHLTSLFARRIREEQKQQFNDGYMTSSGGSVYPPIPVSHTQNHQGYDSDDERTFRSRRNIVESLQYEEFPSMPVYHSQSHDSQRQQGYDSDDEYTFRSWDIMSDDVYRPMPRGNTQGGVYPPVSGEDEDEDENDDDSQNPHGDNWNYEDV